MAIGPVEAYIRQEAAKRGIDPDIAVRVARSEGGLNDPFRRGQGKAPRSQDPRLGPTENSFGPLQLYVSGTGAGLGDRAMAAGIDPSKDWQGGIDFALDEVARAGWGQWYGAKGQGITGMMGVNGRPGPRPNEATVAEYRAGTAGDKPVFVGDAPVMPVQEEAAPAANPFAIAATDAKPDDKNPWRKKLAKAVAGYKAPAIAKSDPGALGGFTSQAARVDTPEIAPFDPAQIASQRQQLAMAMQKLNSGKLWL